MFNNSPDSFLFDCHFLLHQYFYFLLLWLLHFSIFSVLVLFSIHILMNSWKLFASGISFSVVSNSESLAPSGVVTELSFISGVNVLFAV